METRQDLFFYFNFDKTDMNPSEQFLKSGIDFDSNSFADKDVLKHL